MRGASNQRAMRSPSSVADMMTQSQIGPQRCLYVERERGAEIALQMALVEFVEQDRADGGQFRVVLNHVA